MDQKNIKIQKRIAFKFKSYKKGEVKNPTDETATGIPTVSHHCPGNK